MRNDLEDEDSMSGSGWNRIICYMILNSPCKCLRFIKSLPRRIKDKFLKQYIAMTILFSSFICLGVAIALSYVIAISYCVSSIVCCFGSLYFQKGEVCYERNSEKLLEQQRLLEQSSRENRRGAHQPEDRRQPLKRALDTLMEPMRRSGEIFEARSPYQVPYDSHRSDIHTPLIYYDSSAGPSSAPDPFPPLNYGDDTSTEESRTSEPVTSSTFAESDVTSGSSLQGVTNYSGPKHIIEDSYNSDEPFRCLSRARLSADGLKAFGKPVHVLGADSYEVFVASDEHCTSTSLSPPIDSSEVRETVAGVKTFQVQVEVHRDSHKSLDYSSDGRSSSELGSIAGDDHCNANSLSPPSGPSEVRETDAGVKTLSGPSEIRETDAGVKTPSGPFEERETAAGVKPPSGPSEVRETAAGVKTFQVQVEVHCDSHKLLTSSNDASNSSELGSTASGISTRVIGSNLNRNLPYVDDDQSSETTCSTPLDEESTKTED